MNERFLIFDRDSASYHCNIIHEGVRRYFREGDHSLTFIPIAIPSIGSFGHMNFDQRFSVVSWFENKHNVEYIQRLQIPYLNLLESEEMSNLGLELTFQGEGTLAAQYFIEEMAFESLAFIGRARLLSHERRYKEFEKVAHDHQIPLNVFKYESVLLDGGNQGSVVANNEIIRKQNEELNHLLRSAQKPLGIFCANDRFALNLYYRAQTLGIHIPEEISILGVGSLQKAEYSGINTISVVQMDHLRQGFCAAQLLENYLTGNTSTKKVILKPDGIIHRETTARREAKDPTIRNAFELINADRSITVNELSKKLNISRDILRNRFYSATNMSVAKFIDLERFKHAKKLLRSRRFNHEAIASLAGYRNHRQMIRSFDRLVQMSPKQFSRIYLDTNRD